MEAHCCEERDASALLGMTHRRPERSRDLADPHRLTLIHQALPDQPSATRVIPVRATRHDLAKTRWRTAAEDGTDFGFDLHHPLQDGDVIHVQDGKAYVMAQEPEPVLVVDPGADRTQWARAGWTLGNLHQPVEVTAQGLRLADEPAARQRIAQLGLSFRAEQAVFHPPRAAAHAHHSHPHDHA